MTVLATPPNRSLFAAFPPLLNRLFAPIPIWPLVYLRIAFGAVMMWEVWRYFNNGWIHRYYIQPEFFFTYYGFDWVRPWPGEWMYVHFHVMGALAFCILIGLSYRLVMPLFFAAFTYVFLLDQTNYLNHFYLISLISFLMIFIPAHRAFSVDALLRPVIRSRTAAGWTLYIIVFQISVAYFYGGIAKLNGDWLQGEPMRMWLAARTDFPVIGHFFTEEWMVFLFSYGGLLLDLFIVPLLLWRRTRWLAVMVLLAFHLTNHHLFSIGIFPWFMMAVIPLYFPPHWWAGLPDAALSLTSRLRLPGQIKPQPALAGDAVPGNLPPVWMETRALPFENSLASGGGIPEPQAITAAGQHFLLAALALYCAFQLLLPLRHFLYPGNVSWTEQGHNFSWHMKLRDKSGRAEFLVIDRTSNLTWQALPEDFLTRRQVSKLPDSPDMILLFSHYLAEKARAAGYEHVEVYAEVQVSLNGRERAWLIDPMVNLAAQPRTVLAADWILPLNMPLRYSSAGVVDDDINDDDLE